LRTQTTNTVIVALEDALQPPSDPAAPPLMSELTEFSYDDMGRLTAATHPERFSTVLPRESYTYSDDGLGSRVSAADTHGRR
jgi:hypothetical protein